ncbi:YceD family protein [Paracoccaceae bacterium GXU_MW_L88]
MSDAALPDLSHPMRTADLSPSQSYPVSLAPEKGQLEVLARLLDILKVEKLRFEGKLAPVGKRDWRLTGKLGATVTQRCVVTLEPVKTRIDTDLHRLYVADLDEDAEMEALEDTHGEEVEALGAVIDVGLAVQEELALALPAYPRKDDAPETAQQFAAEGTEPMTDEDVKPFAGLKALRDKMQKG